MRLLLDNLSPMLAVALAEGGHASRTFETSGYSAPLTPTC
jgi:hypothetical protein